MAAPGRRRLSDIAFEVGIVAVEWVALYELNAVLFSTFSYSDRASWVFAPAAVRVLAVLLFGWTGAAGLVLGAFVTLPHEQLADLPYELVMSLTSGAAPWIAIGACRRYFAIPDTLSSLRTGHIVLASIATAGANSVLVNACLAVFDRWHGDTKQIATIFAGDIVGAALMIGVVVLLARLIGRRAD